METLFAQSDFFAYFDAIATVESLAYRGIWGVENYKGKRLVPKQSGGVLTSWRLFVMLLRSIWSRSFTAANQKISNEKMNLAAKKIENIKMIHERLKGIDQAKLINDSSEEAYYTKKAIALYKSALATFDVWNKIVDREQPKTRKDKIRYEIIRRVGGLLTDQFRDDLGQLKVEPIESLSPSNANVSGSDAAAEAFGKQVEKVQALFYSAAFDLSGAKRDFLRLQIQGGIVQTDDLGEVLERRLYKSGIENLEERKALEQLARHTSQQTPLDREGIESYFELIQKSFTLDRDSNLALFDDTPVDSLRDPHFEKAVEIALDKTKGIKPKLHMLHAVSHHCDGMLTSAISDWLHRKIIDTFEQEFRISGWHILKAEFDVLCTILHFVFGKSSKRKKLDSESEKNKYHQQLAKTFLVKGALETQGREEQFAEFAQEQFPKVYGADRIVFVEDCYEGLRKSSLNPKETPEPLRLFAKLKNFINMASTDAERELIRGMSMELLLECAYVHPSLKSDCEKFAKEHIVGPSAPTEKHIESIFSHISKGVEHFFKHHRWPFPRRHHRRKKVK